MPSLPAVVEALSRRPLRRAAPLLARAGGRRGGADRARARAADRRLLPHGAERLHGAAQRRRGARLRAWRPRLAPSTAAATSCSRRRAASDARLAALGVRGRSGAGTAASTSSASPRRCATRAADGRVRVLYAGRLTKEKGVDLLADAFLAARARDPRLELVLAGGGPEEDALRARLGCGRARFSAGSRATRWPAPTPTPTSSSSARRPTPSGRWCWRRRPRGCPVVAVGARAARPS